MDRRVAVCAVVAGLCSTADARADLTPPARAEIALELSVDNQASLPFLRFVVTNCHPRQTPSVGVLAGDSPTTCEPEPAVPVRVFGFRIADLPDFLEMEKRNAPGTEAAAFLAAKAKTCGQLEDKDLVFPAETGITSVAAKYALEPGPKGGCKLRRVSATTSKGVPAKKPSSAPVPASASAPAPSAAGSAAPASQPQPSTAGCGCGVVGRVSAIGSWPLLIAPLLLWWNKRRRGARRRA